MSYFTKLVARYIVPGDREISGLRAAADIEADALLDAVTKVHCIVIADLDGDQVDEYGPEQIPEALAHLERCSYVTGHNFIGYDLPVLKKVVGWAPPSECTIADTLIAGRVILPNIGDVDRQSLAMGDPSLGTDNKGKSLIGRQSLEAWGARLGIPKIGADIEDWSQWTPEMQARCVGDAKLTKALWQFLNPDRYSQRAIELEHRVAPICERITADGAPFNSAAAVELQGRWTQRYTELEAQLAQQFPGTNLNSRQQIAELLEARGWVPDKRTKKTGRAKIDNETLESVVASYPEFNGLAEYMLLGRRLAALATGDKAWLSHIGADGRIHGGVIHIGTPHSRAKHLDPNLAQVPNPKKGAAYATECRALFRPSNDWVCVAADQSSLQDRGFSHYLHKYDDGAYAQAFLAGEDTHWKTAAALDLVAEGTERNKHNKVHTALREGAKRFRYAFLYGAQAARLGHVIYDTARAAHLIDGGSDLQQRLFGNSEHPDDTKIRKVGGAARQKFLKATLGLKKLLERLQEYAQLADVYAELNERFRYGWNGDVVIALWIHDEIVCYCRPDIADQVGEILVRHAKAAGEHYGFRVPLDADYKVGKSWSDEPKTEPKEKLTIDGIVADAPEATTTPPPPPPPQGNGYNTGPHGHTGPKKGKASAQWIYLHPEQGNYLRVEKRLLANGERKFYQNHWNGKRWVHGVKGSYAETKIPYRLPELHAAPPAEPVWVAEGEKDADTLVGLGLIATTNPGGAHQFQPELAEWFKGKETAYILEDNDAAGREHVEIVGRALQPLVSHIRIVSFRELPEKGDVTDWMELGHTKAELLARAAASPVYQPPALQSIYAADVTMTAVEWLWPNRFGLGKLGIIAGLPDEGKGLLISYIAAQVTNGGAWPCNEGIARRGKVILFTAEDDSSDTIVPRLAAAGADLTRIAIVSMVREAGKDRMFSLQTDLDMLRRKIDAVGDVILVLIDPVSAYLGVGKMDSYRTTDVRAVLGPVVSLAAELKLAVIGIMHFNKKIDVTNALLRISDSLAYGATARHVYGVINDAENKRKLVVRAKNNLTVNTAEQTTLAFSFGVREVGTDPNSDKTIVAPYVVWEPQYVDVSATEAMQAASENKSPGARDEAKKFLLAILAAGPVAKTEIEEAAKAEGIAERTLYRAKRELKNIIARKDAADGGWTWRLCDDGEGS